VSKDKAVHGSNAGQEVDHKNVEYQCTLAVSRARTVKCVCAMLRCIVLFCLPEYRIVRLS
jgi:predicted metal-dependent hydrolase